MLLLVYGLVRAPIDGWGSARTIGVLAGAAAVLAAFVVNEQRQRAPLAPLSIFRINGLGFSNVTQLVAFAGFLALFFYVTLYMQNVLGYSAVQTGLAYLPLCGIAVVSAGISSQLLARVGTRPVIVVGAVIGAAGLYWLSRIPVGGSYVADLLPGLLLVGLGIAGLFVAVATAANAGVPADKAGLAAALLNASQWLGGALGLAIFTAVSTSRTNHLLATGTPVLHALTSGFQRALLVGSIFILASAVIALRATNTRGETEEPTIDAEPEASLAA
jgi:predicted MFS family arabinose efflux permease